MEEWLENTTEDKIKIIEEKNFIKSDFYILKNQPELTWHAMYTLIYLLTDHIESHPNGPKKEIFMTEVCRIHAMGNPWVNDLYKLAKPNWSSLKCTIKSIGQKYHRSVNN